MNPSDPWTEDVRSDASPEAYRLHHDWNSTNSLSQAIASVTISLSGGTPSTGPPLSRSVDPDALDRLFRFEPGTDNPDDHLTFTHCGCRIIVYRSGLVVAYPPERMREV